MKWRLLGAAALGLGLAVAATGAANADTWNLLSGTLSPSGHPNGNVLTVNSAAGTLTVTGWSTHNGGSAGDKFLSGAIYQYSPYGIGLCNSGEGPNCQPPNHTFDNDGRDDFALFYFDSDMDISSITLTGFGDTDVSYFVGHIDATGVTWDIANLLPSVSSLTGAGASDVFEGEDLGPVLNETSRTVNINQTGNFLLIGADLNSQCTTTYDHNHNGHTSCSYDYVKFNSITATPSSVVPEPATWSLMIVGFGLLGEAFRRRMARA